MKYRIELDKLQLHFIAQCVELTSRIYCGQLDMNTLFPLDDESYKQVRSLDDDCHRRRLEKVNKSLQEIKDVIWGDKIGDAHYGIGYDEKADHLYDMYKEIYYAFEEEKRRKCEENGEKYSTNVHSNQPSRHTEDPRITVYPLTKDILRDENIDKVLGSE